MQGKAKLKKAKLKNIEFFLLVTFAISLERLCVCMKNLHAKEPCHDRIELLSYLESAQQDL